MKITTVVLISSLTSGVGVYTGKTVFNSTSFISKTIKEVLEESNIPVLDVDITSNVDDEAWLVLAQKYRENGIVQRGEDRKPELWKDPEFLNQEKWKELNIPVNEKHNFSKDELLSKALKEHCGFVLNQKYSYSLYEKTEKWCSLVLPEEVKTILKLQKLNGDCRFWIVQSSPNSTGRFIWEYFEDFGFSNDDLLSLSFALKDGSNYSPIVSKNPKKNSVSDEMKISSFKSTRGYQILKDCKEIGKNGKFLELVKRNLPNYGGKIRKSFQYWKNPKKTWQEHKLANLD